MTISPVPHFARYAKPAEITKVFWMALKPGVHVYGMTEMDGVAALCDQRSEWITLSSEQRYKQMARQGVRTVVTDDMIVADPVSLEPIPRDSSTIGDILFRGNNGTKGYLMYPGATERHLPATGTEQAILP